MSKFSCIYDGNREVEFSDERPCDCGDCRSCEAWLMDDGPEENPELEVWENE